MVAKGEVTRHNISHDIEVFKRRRGAEVAWKRESEARKLVIGLRTTKRRLESWNGKDEPRVEISFVVLHVLPLLQDHNTSGALRLLGNGKANP